MKIAPMIVAILLFGLLSGAARAVTPSAGEMLQTQQWLTSHFPSGQPAPHPVGLAVLANHDPVIRNSRGGRPLTLGDKQFTRGLYCHAISSVQVFLPGPAARFTATVGVDNNDQTSGGRGSVIFTVRAGGKDLFTSPLMHGGGAGVPADVDLGGVTDFFLNVSDAGLGISCDQSDWADAKVVLQNGQEIWVGDLPFLQPSAGGPPFSFVYGGHSSREFLAGWKLTDHSEALDPQRTRRTLTWTDPATGLEVRCVLVTYQDFPAAEWTLYFHNTGAADTPVLEQIQALDFSLEDQPGVSYQLHHSVGSPAGINDYQPLVDEMRPGIQYRLGSRAGRPSDPVMPYWNLAGPSGGAIFALGWPGQWAAQFSREGPGPLRVTGGQELTHFLLHPGEEVRGPLAVVLFYGGDWIRGQNLWRRWMIAHNLPRPGGKPLVPETAACSSGQFGEMINANEANQEQFIARYDEEKLTRDYWWMDAGWYVNDGHWWNVGTWEVDPKRFPHGLRAISDFGRARGWKTLVWFEPERVTPGTYLYTQHPEWLLGSGDGDKMLDLGNPAAWQWLTDHISQLLTDQGIDLYRQDCNFDLLSFWRGHDTPDRQGITEIRYVTGLLAYWDALVQRHPGLLIDTCASGGRRLDLETLRRAVPLHRTDFQGDPLGPQNHTYGLALWTPFYGAGLGSFDAYDFRSRMCPHMTWGYDMRVAGLDFSPVRRLYAQWEKIAPNWFGDYYPLSQYSLTSDAWVAWQFDRPETGEGVVQVFKRPESPYETARYRLRGLDPDARYRLTNLDDDTTTEASGKDLMEQGVPVALAKRPDSLVLLYGKVKP
jgi:alpha-galactosidase